MKYITVKDLFLTSKLRDLRMIIAFILFVQPVFSSTFKSFVNKLPIKPKLGEVSAFDEEDCQEVGLSNFKGKYANVIAFGNQVCYAFSLSKIDQIFLHGDFKTNSILKDAKEWTTYVPKLKLAKDRVVFWPLTKTSKGRNFGSAGSAMDLDASPCGFTLEGGPLNSKARFCKIPRGSRVKMPLKQGGLRAMLESSNVFTIGLWVKGKNCNGDCMLVGSIPTYGPRFAIWPTSDQIVLAFGESNDSMAISTSDNRDLQAWRHLAVVHKPPRGATFYLNGENWPVRKEITDLSGKITPRGLMMFQSYYGSMRFNGQMACVTIHKVALSNLDIKYINKFCP